MWTAGQWGLTSGAVINNQMGAVFDIAGDLFFDDSTAFNSTFNNFGTVRQSAGAGIATWEPQFNVDGTGVNEGLVEVTWTSFGMPH
jgi:hypothetical protein